MYYSNREKVYMEIHSDIEIIKDNLKNMKIQSFLESSKTYKLIAEIEKEINAISKSIIELKEPFLLFVMGPGKYGKSTLINSLIKDNKLKTKDIPNTWRLDILTSSNYKKMDIVSVYETKSYNYDEGLSILEAEEAKFKNSKKVIKDKFEKIKKHNDLSIYDLKECKKSLEEKYLYKYDIVEVKHYINKSGVLNDFIIVDTPGLNQNLLKNTKERMVDYYKRADGIIWVLDAKNIVSKSSNDMIVELNENYILSDDYNNIICAVNKVDEIRNKDNDLSKVKEEVKNLYKNYFVDIVFISSKEAIDGYISNDKKLTNLSNIEELRKSIDSNFKINSEKMQIKSKYMHLKISGEYLKKLINVYKRDLYEDLYKFDEVKRSINYEIEKLKSYFEKKINICTNIENLKTNGVYTQLNDLENLLEIELNNMYLSLNKKILCCDETDDLNHINVNISKSKEILNIEYLIKEENNQYKEIDFLSKLKKIKNYETNVYLIIDERNKLRSNLLNYLDSQLNSIEKDIINKSTKAFRRKYTDYMIIKEHLRQVNDIDNILKKWGDYVG